MEHAEKLKEIFPHQASYIDGLYRVLTTNLTPQLNLLVAFTAMKEMYDKGMHSIFSDFGKVLYAPLSIVAQTGEHQWTRFRPQPVEELHTSFLSFMMARPNRLALNGLLGSYGLRFSQLHCCGILFGAKEAVQAVEKSDIGKARNVMRSYAEAMSMPVRACNFAEVPEANSDLGTGERAFYALYEQIFQELAPSESRQSYEDLAMEEVWRCVLMAISRQEAKVAAIA